MACLRETIRLSYCGKMSRTSRLILLEYKPAEGVNLTDSSRKGRDLIVLP